MAIKRTYLYEQSSDIPVNLSGEKNNIVVYSRLQKKRKITKKSVTGTNFIDLPKLDMAIGILDLLNATENLRLELTDSRIREKVYMKRLSEHGLPTQFSPEEIKEYRTTIDVVMREKIDDLMDKGITNIRQEMLNKVSKVIAEARDDISETEEYNVIRLGNLIKINDVIIDELANSNIAKDKKAKAIKDLQETTMKLIDKRFALIKELKLSEPKSNDVTSSDNVLDFLG